MVLDYKQAGVDIEAGAEAVSRIKARVKTTHNKNVVSDLGSFGALYSLAELKNYNEPILVQSIDGVGTKVMIGRMTGQYSTLGEDIVNHCCNDIVVQGAKPLTFLDYIASFRTEPKVIEEIVKGMVKACREVGVCLIGGETAEMGRIYQEGELDIAGCITGVVEKDSVIKGDDIKEGDVILGLPSSGLHTNGFSLVRKIFFEAGGFDVNYKFAELSATLGEELLKPHRNYTKSILYVLEKFNTTPLSPLFSKGGDKRGSSTSFRHTGQGGVPRSSASIKGVAHITGGGLIENVPRILPNGLSAEIKRSSWPVLPIFQLIQRLSGIEEREMFRVFNMGIGMVIVVESLSSAVIRQELESIGETVYEIGEVVKGEGKVKIS